MSFARIAACCGAGAALASIAAVVVSSRIENGSNWRAVNATSHFLWGPENAVRDEVDVAHTGVGLSTNVAAAFFWGSVLALALDGRPRRSPPEMLRDASVVAALAGVVDYGIVPRRMRPGWELALSKTAVVSCLAAMALGLAGGGLAAQGSGASRSTERRVRDDRDSRLWDPSTAHPRDRQKPSGVIWSNQDAGRRRL